MSDGSSSRKRKVRGRKITSDREDKQQRRARKQLDRASGGDGSTEAASGGGAISPEEAMPEPFVATDEIDALEDRISRWLDAEQPVHLIGPTGCGKTALALYAASRRGRPVVWINGDEIVDTEALVGEHAGGERYEEHDQFVAGVSKHTEIVRERWIDNPLSVAVREGATLVYNEFSRTPPEAHNVLLSVLEEGVLERPTKRGEDRQIDVHPEFRVIVTSNTAEYAGVHEQQDALLDRFVGVHVDYYGPDTEREIVRAHTDIPDEQLDRIVSITQALRDELDVVVGTRVAITAAKGLVAFSAAGASGDATDEDGDDTESDDEDDTGATTDELVTVFTDVLAPKVAESGDVTELSEQIRSVIQ